ncbi:hypothetical protein BDR06DRAFT_964738 [Suillus hirtellus]|nr:hypothetical protein BDR06DRAFT_964738 [Suillus hirtellus]
MTIPHDVQSSNAEVSMRSPRGFFDRVLPNRSHFSARSRPHSSAPQGSTFLGRLFQRNPSNTRHKSASSPLDWARSLFTRRRRNRDVEGTKLWGREPQMVDIPCGINHGRVVAREKRMRTYFPPKISTAGSSQPPSN